MTFEMSLQLYQIFEVPGNIQHSTDLWSLTTAECESLPSRRAYVYESLPSDCENKTGSCSTLNTYYRLCQQMLLPPRAVTNANSSSYPYLCIYIFLSLSL